MRDMREREVAFKISNLFPPPFCVGAIISFPDPLISHLALADLSSPIPQFYFPAAAAAAAIQEGLNCTPSCEYRDYIFGEREREREREFTHSSFKVFPVMFLQDSIATCCCTEMQKNMWARLRESRMHQGTSHTT